jgi:DNA polymerase-3 subunit alpha
MAFVTIEDMHGAVEVIVFSRVFSDVRDLLEEDRPLLVQGQVQKDEKSVKILADTVIPIDKAEETWAASVHLNLETSRTDREGLENLHAILKRHPGQCPAFLHLRGPDNTDAVISLPEGFKLKAGSSLTREVNGFLGYHAVETRCSKVPASVLSNGVNGRGKFQN